MDIETFNKSFQNIYNEVKDNPKCEILYSSRFSPVDNDDILNTLILKGLYDWEYFFGKHGISLGSSDKKYLKDRLEEYQILFPSIDVSEYLKRFEELS